ncbi:MAG: hypothetical protein Q4C15_09170 [Eubacteriales bacterium]|nr:hypothetical protein [Eubacteriales bacterium]
MREEKKYEILPGVEIPDIKKIQEAASDFSISEVGDVEIRTVTLQPVAAAVTPSVSADELSQLQSLGVKVAEDEERSKAESRAKMDAIMNKAVQAPESIGDLKASHIAQLNDEKLKKQLEDEIKEAEAQKAEEDAKNKAREERRQLQQRLLEESREKAAKEKEAQEKAAKEAAAKEEEEIKKAAEEMAAKLMQPVEEKKEEAAKTEDAPKTETPKSEADKKEEPSKVEEAPKAEEKKPEEAQKPAQSPATPGEVPIEKKTVKVLSASETYDEFKEFLEEE